MTTEYFRLGKDCKAYRNTNTYISPTWVAIDAVKDATLKVEVGEWDGSRRGSGGWKQFAPTMLSAEIELDIIFAPAETGYVALRNAFLGRTIVDMLILTGLIAVDNNEGLRSEMYVFGLDRDEKLEEGVMIKGKVKPAISTNAPYWVNTNASVLVTVP